MAQEYLIFVRQCILSQVRESDGRVQGHGTSDHVLGALLIQHGRGGEALLLREEPGPQPAGHQGLLQVRD